MQIYVKSERYLYECVYQWSRRAACGLRWWRVSEWGSLRCQTLRPAPSPLWHPLWPNASLVPPPSASQQPLHTPAPAVYSDHTREHLRKHTRTKIHSCHAFATHKEEILKTEFINQSRPLLCPVFVAISSTCTDTHGNKLLIATVAVGSAFYPLRCFPRHGLSSATAELICGRVEPGEHLHGRGHVYAHLYTW